MGFVSFLKLGLKYFFDFLAWPLFALVCPLYASVQAIESNSKSDMRNLVAYWIVFSLISLFELAFVKLIEWLPFWPYMKLMAICWLGIPNFNSACYVYECLIRSCLAVNLQGVIKRFVKHKDDQPFNAESFLAVAERYVKENGSEVLEKLIDRSRHRTPNIDVEEIKAVTNTEEKETATAIQVKCVEEPNLSQTEKKTGLFLVGRRKRLHRLKLKKRPVIEAVRENEVVDVPVVAAGGGENKVQERPTLENVQKEWTCAVCQVTTFREEDLKSHLHGRKHKSQCAELKAIKHANKNKGCSSSTANQEPQKPISGNWINQNKSKKQEGKAQVNQTSEQCKQKEVKNTTGYGVNKSKLRCTICNVKCPGEVAMASHLKGKKHLSQVRQIMDPLGGGHY